MPVFVNQVEISDEAIHSEMQYHPAENVDAARDKAISALVVRELVLQEARSQKILRKEADDPEEEEAAIEVLLHQEISVPDADELSCRTYYENNKSRFLEETSGSPVPFEKVKEHIEKYLQTRSLRAGISQYIQMLAGNARIVGFEFKG